MIRHARLQPAAVAALALALSACSLGPAYRRPSIPPPPAWQTPAAAAMPQGWPASDWWSGFHSAELARLIATGESANDDLAAAIARVREADAQVRISSAPLLPSLDGSASGSRQRQISPTSGSTTLYNEFAAGLNATYELDFWGENRAIRSAALAAANASRYDRETVDLTVMSGIADTYFSVLALRERLRIARANLASADETLQGLKTDEEVGTSNALDVAQQDTVVATIAATIPPLEQQERQQIDALAILVGQTPQSLSVAATSLTGIAAPAVSAGVPSQLLARRPDVANAEAQLIAANANIRAARAAFFPTIDLTASGGFESKSLSTLLEPGSKVFALSAGLTQPIFRGGAVLGEYRLSKARYDELLAGYHKAVISAFGNVEDSLAGVIDTGEQLQREQIATDKARGAYGMSQEQFHAGTVNILTVLGTETSLFSAEDALAQAQLAHLQALVGLYNALGGGWSIEQGH
ncbi:MAG TPA: efflux transporter outer membrane subunit [Steroidobacteraceae bacterium]|nr:efflux transporter outer membrane subunit [Steroidobacteraceae bacterium]